MIIIKTSEKIAAMREGGKMLAEILHELAIATAPGITTEELDAKAEKLIKKWHVLPSFKGYRGFPCVLCTSINEEVVHAIPSKRALKSGDIISIDCGVIHKGFHTDSAVTVLIGDVTPQVRKFVYTVQTALEKGINTIMPGSTTGDIGAAVQFCIESNGYSVVKDYIGHGVGKNLHEKPEIPNFGKRGSGTALIPGMTIAIEPIIAMGQRFTDVSKDGWTVTTRDKFPACQIEHTVLITQTGHEVLTKYNGTINNVYPQ